jgi:hypothetical protein
MTHVSQWQGHHPRYRRGVCGRPSSAGLAPVATLPLPADDGIMAQLATARRMADGLQPYSPAWDAAMGWIDDLEASLAHDGSSGASSA